MPASDFRSRRASNFAVVAWTLVVMLMGCGSDKSAAVPATPAPVAPAATVLPAAAVGGAAAAAAAPAAVTQASWQPDALEELLAPIALYPDALLSQILAASVNSQEVLDGGNWLLQNENLKGDALDEAAEKAGFGPAMRALVQFPTVVDMMCQQIDWTKQLGSAFTSDQASVLDAVQRLRAQAKDVGNLKSTPQQTVETKTENNKIIVEVKPADPQVIYVPQYDPQVVYTTAPPATTTTTTQSSGVSTGAAVAGALLAFGVGVMVGNAFHDDYYYPHWGYGSMYFGPRPFYPPAYVYRPVYGPAFRPAYHYAPPPGYRYNYNHINVQNNINVNVNNNYFNRFDNNQNLRAGNANSPISGTKHGVGATQRAGQTAGGTRDSWKGQSTYAGNRNPATQARLNQAAGRPATAQDRPQQHVGGAGGTRNPSAGTQHVDRGYGGSTRSPSRDIASQARPSQSATPRPATTTHATSRPASRPDNAFSGARSSGNGSFDRAASARGHASAGSRPHPARSARRR
ncbi:MAG TPA: DUF3300 domain-containing protein [Povalibacter sp.]|uniref:DUF3300 domain-containing protein n=1 Tax=Povalibacter sp. TaxID=1962978 RepID=UPI002C31BE08|nr:DUF3300 domain-containing protein [Povalibacter sp.]HMN47252.1 DUF3300 domain-containing protein [Povalibacter sp.]